MELAVCGGEIEVEVAGAPQIVCGEEAEIEAAGQCSSNQNEW